MLNFFVVVSVILLSFLSSSRCSQVPFHRCHHEMQQPSHECAALYRDALDVMQVSAQFRSEKKYSYALRAILTSFRLFPRPGLKPSLSVIPKPKGFIVVELKGGSTRKLAVYEAEAAYDGVSSFYGSAGLKADENFWILYNQYLEVQRSGTADDFEGILMLRKRLDGGAAAPHRAEAMHNPT
jgi:hypothetical protein